ncbi:MAG: M20/M25/M40 family metallo-hydrolase [Candidatus Limiplasma sp.]|nr:M20/M25/M40 family metallo-hydrolase [Clostridiales bacterium]MDY4063413.1 M20/M25/M40 family metallo-hydrolase [Candidatus Limiplasma sp.]
MDMMNTLKNFMLTPAPSGYENEMAYRMMDCLKPFCQNVTIDHVGNVIARVEGRNGSNLPRLMIFGHMDQLGFIVRRIEPDGYLQVDRLGGIPEKVLPGLQLLIRSEDGRWHQGVFGPKAHHATPAEEKYKVDLVTSLFIDVGAKSDTEVRSLGIEVGCPVIYKPAFENLMGTRVTGTAVDNRGSCAALVGIAEHLSSHRPACDVYLVGTVWEEFNLRGAMMAARTVKPDLAIMLDVTLAGDTHDLKGRFEDKLGEGPCVTLYSFHGRGTLNGTLPHQPLFDLCKKTAVQEGFHLQRFASLGIVTDAAYLQLEQDGVACLEMGFPARYTHTPIEVCDVSDLEDLARLVAAMACNVDDKIQINRY